jgi:hypothetical protein
MTKDIWAGIGVLAVILLIFHHVLSIFPDTSCINANLDPEISLEYTSSMQAKCRKVKHP